MMCALSKPIAACTSANVFFVAYYNLHIMPLNFGLPVFRLPENLYGVCGNGNVHAWLLAGESTPP